jgi:aspartate/methionine/tyrosine aminotransferase
MADDFSAAMDIAQLLASAKGRPDEAIDLAAGLPHFGPDEEVKQAAHDAARHHGKSTVGLLAEFCSEVASGRPAMAVLGARNGMFLALNYLLREGGAVLIPTPAWSGYGEIVRTAGGIPVMVTGRPEAHYRAQLGDLEAALDGPQAAKRPRAVLLASPTNPTGTDYPPDEVKALAAWAAGHDSWLIIDRVYGFYSGTPEPDPAAWPPNVLVANSLSKSHGMPDYRIGWLAGDRDLLGALSHPLRATIGAPPRFAVAAGLAAIRGDNRAGKSARETYAANHRLGMQLLACIAEAQPAVPDAPFYLNLRLPAELRSHAQHVAASLPEAGVIVMPGEALSHPGTIRVCCARDSQTFRAGMIRIVGHLQRALTR